MKKLNKNIISKISFFFAAILFVVSMFISPPSKNTSLAAVTGNWNDYNNDVEQLKDNDKNGYRDISSAKELSYFIEHISSYATSKVELTKSFSMSGHYLYPSTSVFSGEFNGNNYVVSGLSLASKSVYCSGPNRNVVCTGLFGYTSGAKIMNLTLNNPKITSLGEMSSYLVSYGDNETTITNCRVNSGSISLVSEPSLVNMYVGSFVGYSYLTTVSKSSSTSTIKISTGTYTNIYAGGIIGYCINSNVTLSSNFKAITITKGANVYAGGICGYVTTANYETKGNEITKNGNTGNISVGNSSSREISYAAVGGIVGEKKQQTSGNLDTAKIVYCFNRGSINAYTKEFSSTSNLGLNFFTEISVADGYHPNYMFCNQFHGDYKYNKKTYDKEGKYTSQEYSTKTEKGYHAYCGGILGRTSDYIDMDGCYNVGTIQNDYNTQIVETYNYYIYQMYLKQKWLGWLFVNAYNRSAQYYNRITLNFEYTYSTSGSLLGDGNIYLGGNLDNQNIQKTKKCDFSIGNYCISSGNGAWCEGRPADLTSNTITDVPYWCHMTDGDATLMVTLKNSIYFYEDGDDVKFIINSQSGNIVDEYVFTYKSSKNCTSSNLKAKNTNILGSGGETSLYSGVWAVDTTGKINAGYPYIKDMYWIQDTQEPSKA